LITGGALGLGIVMLIFSLNGHPNNLLRLLI
jgi:hypothetical protein